MSKITLAYKASYGTTTIAARLAVWRTDDVAVVSLLTYVPLCDPPVSDPVHVVIHAEQIHGVVAGIEGRAIADGFILQYCGGCDADFLTPLHATRDHPFYLAREDFIRQHGGRDGVAAVRIERVVPPPEVVEMLRRGCPCRSSASTTC